jgi:hypothetical protein
MIKFFRKIRYDLMEKNKTGKYLKYAIGEIILVVIGILIALSINNWNENRKSKIASVEIYNNLLQTLRQDSIKIQQIIKFQKRSIEAQEKILTSNMQSDYIVKNNLMIDIIRGSISFFPNEGPYNSIVSNNELDLIYSKTLKTSIINLYDFQYKRYKNIDAIVDNKFQNQIFSIIDKKMMIYSVDTLSKDGQLIRRIDPILLNRHYSELESEIKDTYRIMKTGFISLLEIQKSINDLIIILKEDLDE